MNLNEGFAWGQRDVAVRDANKWQAYAHQIEQQYDRANYRVSGLRGVVEALVKELRTVAPNSLLLDKANRNSLFDEAVQRNGRRMASPFLPRTNYPNFKR